MLKILGRLTLGGVILDTNLAQRGRTATTLGLRKKTADYADTADCWEGTDETLIDTAGKTTSFIRAISEIRGYLSEMCAERENFHRL